MLTHILIGLLVLAAAAGFLIVSPTRRCPRCKGERVTRSFWNNRIISCPRCKGTGRARRRGATLTHRLIWQLRDAITTAHPDTKEK